MKMITIRKILTLAAFAFAPLIISCSNIADREEEFKAVLTAEQSKSECAYIKVNVENTDLSSRTLLPKVEISNLVLTGKRGNGETQVLSKADTLLEMSAKQIEIQTESDTETWKFTLTAMVSGVAYSSGEVSKEIKSGGENPLTFTLEPADGKTTGDLIFSINPIGTEGVEYEAILKIDDAEEPRYSFKNGETSPNWSLSLEAGTYTLTVEFYAKNANNQTDPTDPSLPKNSNSECLNIYKSIVRIEKGITTKAEVTNFNLNQVYSITYDGYEPTVKEGVPVADTLDPVNTVMTLKFSRKGGDTDGYIALPKLSNSSMTFSGWYTKNPTAADFSESSKVPESGTAPNTVQKIKATENLSNLTLYAKWLVSSNGTVYTLADYNFSFALKNQDGSDVTGIYPGTNGVFTLTPEIKKNGTVIPLTIESGKTLVEENEITWSASLWNDGILVPGNIEITPNPATGIITLKVPAQTYRDNYILKITSKYLEHSHDANFLLNISKSAANTASYISTLTEAGEYTVEVEGGVGYGENEGLAKVASAIKSRPSSVLINLDASNTSNTSSISSYNNGAYFKECTQLKSIILPEWMQYVVSNLFKGCTNLTSVTLSTNTQWICENAFNGCSKLDSITIPKGITGSGSTHGIQAGAFVGCKSGFTITYQGTKELWKNVKRTGTWHDGLTEFDDSDGSVTCKDGKCGFDYVPPTPVSNLTGAPTSGLYTLSTLNELKKIKDWVANNNTLENVKFILEADINTGGAELIIGYYKYNDANNRAFKGVFDGNNHSITNKITANDVENSANIALFSYVTGASSVIKNLTVKGTSTRGSIVGYLDGSATVENCISETVITPTVKSIGGIVCYLEHGYVRNCINKGNITSNKPSVGGILGETNSGSGAIDRCINKGNISGYTSTGGIVGYMQSGIPITNCKNYGTISSGTMCGGIIAFYSNWKASLNNNCNFGEVSTGGGIFYESDTNSPKFNNNCNSNTVQYGVLAHFGSSVTEIKVANNYSLNVYTSALYPSTANGSFNITEDKIKGFAISDASNVVERLNSWASTNSTDSLQYASWKLNEAGKPELDLGELDSK